MINNAIKVLKLAELESIFLFIEKRNNENCLQ